MIDIDLTKKERLSNLYKFFFILGGLFFIATGLYRIISRDSFVFDFTFMVDILYALLGLVWLLNGLNILNAWMKRTVRIDETYLNFKSSALQKEKSILWNDIGSIEIKVNKLIISSKEKNLETIELGWIPYNDLIEIKTEIEKLSGEKNINCKRD